MHSMSEIFTTHSADETRTLGKRLAEQMPPRTCLCLSGDLGSGKTTFAQGLLEGFGATRPYTSPTFVIMKQYDLPASDPKQAALQTDSSVLTEKGIRRIYHADAYRVAAHDFETLGFAEWCADPNGIVILEWPERVEQIIPKNVIMISFTAKNENEREITIG